MREAPVANQWFLCYVGPETAVVCGAASAAVTRTMKDGGRTLSGFFRGDTPVPEGEGFYLWEGTTTWDDGTTGSTSPAYPDLYFRGAFRLARWPDFDRAGFMIAEH